MVNPDFRAWLEIAYFVSGIILAVLAAIGLRQLIIARELLEATRAQVQLAGDALKVAKNDLAVRSKREAVVLAAQRCEQFATALLPSVNPRLQAIHAGGVPIREWTLNNTLFAEGSLQDGAAGGEWVQNLLALPEARLTAMRLVNDLEAFAMYFARGAADEEVAYPVVGALFCFWVRQLAPYIARVRAQQVPGVTSGPYENIVSLYSCWAGRTRQTQLTAEANRIATELAAAPPVVIRPIGTAVE